MGETLSSKTRTLSSSYLPVTWFKSARFVFSWASDKSWLIAIETQRMYPKVICSLTCGPDRTIHYVIVQKPDPVPQSITSRTGSNNQNCWTINTQKISTLQLFQSISHTCKNFFHQSCPEEFTMFPCECIVNLLKRNLQSLKRHHVTKFQNAFHLLSLSKKNHLEAKMGRFGTWKMPETYKSLYFSCFEAFGLTCNSLSPFLLLCTTTDVWKFRHLRIRSFESIKLNKIPHAELIRSKRKYTQNCLHSRLSVRQNFVLSSYQTLKLVDFNMGWWGNWTFTVRLCSSTSS